MGKSCGRIIERLTAYVDELLPEAERAEIEQHLGKCPPCQTCACAERTARSVLRAVASRLRAEAVPPELRARCEQSLKGRKR
jgi:anti-sigma factor (TIGR02949 family)